MPAMSSQSAQPNSACFREHGAALLMALVLLVIVTLVGFAAARSSQLQMRLAANQYSRSMAFAAAEAHLDQAEAFLRQHTVSAIDAMILHDCSQGEVCTTNPLAGATVAAGQAYVIEKMHADRVFVHAADAHKPECLHADGDDADCPQQSIIHYRLTAHDHAAGRDTDHGNVILQATIEYRTANAPHADAALDPARTVKRVSWREIAQ